jgi:hypothetical protein
VPNTGLSLSGKEEGMAEHQPQKAGAYERPLAGTSRSMAVTLSIIAVVAVIIVAILFLR